MFCAMLRGFTCGLWTLFHVLSLSVMASAKSDEPVGQAHPDKIGTLKPLPANSTPKVHAIHDKTASEAPIPRPFAPKRSSWRASAASWTTSSAAATAVSTSWRPSMAAAWAAAPWRPRTTRVRRCGSGRCTTTWRSGWPRKMEGR